MPVLFAKNRAFVAFLAEKMQETGSYKPGSSASSLLGFAVLLDAGCSKSPGADVDREHAIHIVRVRPPRSGLSGGFPTRAAAPRGKSH